MLSLAMKKGRTHDSSNIFNITEDAHTRTQQHTRTQCGCEGGGGGGRKEGVCVEVVEGRVGLQSHHVLPAPLHSTPSIAPPPLGFYRSAQQDKRAHTYMVSTTTNSHRQQSVCVCGVCV